MKLNYSIGKQVPLKDVKEGVFYYCPLADKPVLATKNGSLPTKAKFAMYYSDNYGKYMFEQIEDNQLMELEFTRL